MAISKVVYGTSTLIDLTSDTVQANKLLQGYTAHAQNGSVVTGTFVPASVTGTDLTLNGTVSGTNLNLG